MRVPRSALCLLILTIEPVLVLGQTLPSAVIEQINVASKARVNLVEGGRGTVYGPTADSTSVAFARSEFLNQAGNTVDLPSPFVVGQMREIQLARGNHAGKGAAIGAAAGATLALLAVLAASGETLTAPSTGQAVGAVVVWSGIGAGVGALIGAASPRWKTVYKH